MKKILVIAALVLLAAIPIIADDQVARWLLSQVSASEPAVDSDSFVQEKVTSLSSPAAFADKYRWSLKARYDVLRYAFFMGNYKLCKDLAVETLTRYKDSSLANEEKYQDFLFYEARAWEESSEYKYVNARADYSLFFQNYPDNPKAGEAKQRFETLDALVKGL
jgi:hypothetical protein